jgi:ABC-type branched-subunit amino acid transport system substrate-binding protein
MKRRLIKVVVVAMAGLLLLGVPGLVGCGGGEGGDDGTIRIGVLADFTGPATDAVKPTVDAFLDSFKWAEENDPIPGVNIDAVTYDQRTDPSRVPLGFEWLRGRDVLMMYIMSPTDRSILADKFEEHQMVVVGSGVDEAAPNNPWVFNWWPSYGHETEAFMQWVMETWDYEGEGRSPKLGHLSWNLPTGSFHQAGIDRMLDEYPDKFEFLGEERPPVGTSTFAIEVNNLKDCDYVFTCVAGSMVAGFVNESRQRGYTGALVSGTTAFGGYWDLVLSSADPDQLYDCYLMYPAPWWNEDVPFIEGAAAAVQAYHAGDAATRLRGTGPISGWGVGMVTVDALRRAVESVGVDNLDGAALREALLATNLTVEGFGNVWQYGSDYNCVLRTMKVYEWNIDAEDWEDTGHGWITPLSMAS